jgi:hypothetical protein
MLTSARPQRGRGFAVTSHSPTLVYGALTNIFFRFSTVPIRYWAFSSLPLGRTAPCLRWDLDEAIFSKEQCSQHDFVNEYAVTFNARG